MNSEQPQFDSGEGVEERRMRELETAWREKREEIDSTVDRIGEGIDENIKETVVAFRMNKLPTSASCEGHEERSACAPWVDIETPDEPEYRVEGEEQIRQEIAEKYGITAQQLSKEDWDTDRSALTELWDRFGEQEENEEYRRWTRQNEELERKARELLAHFYEDREVPSDVQIQVEPNGAGNRITIRNGGENDFPDRESLSKAEKEELALNLRRYQEEMQAFTQFLKERYFEKG